MAVRKDTLEPRFLEELQMDHNHGSSTPERAQIILIILPYRWESFLSSANAKVFNGSSPVDFNFWRQTFQMECVAAGIWDVIKPPDGATQAMTAAINGTVGALSSAEIVANLAEDYFTHIKPPDSTYTLTRNIMDGRLASLSEFYQDRMDRLSLNEGALPQLELNKLLISTRRDWENERFKVEQSESDILHQLASAVTHYDRLKKENAITQAKCLKVFKDCLGPAPKALVREELLEGRYRAAYLTLYMHYNSGVGGVQSSIDLLKMIQNVPWEPQKMGVLEHIEKLDTLIALATSQGAPVGERSRMAYIISSLQKAKQKEFEKDLEEAERGNHTLPWLIQRLSRTATNIAMKGKNLGKRNQYDLYSPHEEDAEFIGAAQEKAQLVYCLPSGKRVKNGAAQNYEHAYFTDAGLVCHKCGKTGHTAEGCWKDKNCATCGMLGHIAKYCHTVVDKSLRDKVNQKNAKLTQVQK
jgi:hypothetical protein